jgi:hypothetical protein
MSNRALTTAAKAIAAVGFGVLALPQMADAEVVFTPINTHFSAPNGHFSVDFNNDGIADIKLAASSRMATNTGFESLEAYGLQRGNGIAVKKKYAYAGRGGQELGSSAHFSSLAIMASRHFNTKGSSHNGYWQDVKSRRFLGVKFLINGETHFGWVRFSMASDSGATITGYAYETIPNKPIIAGLGNDGQPVPETLASPAPGSLGDLAAGALRRPR